MRAGVTPLFLLVSAANPLVGWCLLVRPAHTTTSRRTSSSLSRSAADLLPTAAGTPDGRRQRFYSSRTSTSRGYYKDEEQDHEAPPPSLRRIPNHAQLPSLVQDTNAVTTTTTAETVVSLARQALATVALAAALTPAVFIGEVTVSPLLAGKGGVPPPTSAFAELEPLPLKSYSEEFSSGLAPVNTVRGLWRTRETRNDGSSLPQEAGRLGRKGICGGRLSFKGFVGAGKGTVEYKGCGDREGKGRWLTKPKNIVNGRITLSARWSVNFTDGTTLFYRGDVVQDAEAQGTALTVDTSGAAAMGGPAFERPDAHIRGEVLRPVKNIQGSLTEKKIGEFEADLIELPSDEDKL
ncbi:unnamed protein product [Ectocarpus sp. CCAP 1310/34]|nr:unnamed protein product [Ectocarpus sp. CCAP 1310/34]